MRWPVARTMAAVRTRSITSIALLVLLSPPSARATNGTSPAGAAGSGHVRSSVALQATRPPFGRASDDVPPALVAARQRTIALSEQPDALRLRHKHLRVIRAWQRAKTTAVRAEHRAEASRGYAAAWAKLAHWSGRTDDARRAADLWSTVPTPARTAEVRSTTAEVRSTTDAPARTVEVRSTTDAPARTAEVRSTTDAPARTAEVRSTTDAPARRAALRAIVADVRKAYPRVARQLNAAVNPTAPDSPAPEAAPLRIVIDAGHGGRDRGATGLAGMLEKDVNLELAQALGRRLTRTLGARVTYTRTDDHFVSLGRRIRLANASRADLFISVHANAHSSEQVHGVETYAMRRSGRSARLAQLVQSEVIRSLRRRHPAVKSLGVKAARFRVLRGVTMPAVLIETGFLTHEIEARRLKSVAYRQDLIAGIVRGVRQFADRSTKAWPAPLAGLKNDDASLSLNTAQPLAETVDLGSVALSSEDLGG